jgi:phosphoribosylformylglycinamidine cyclo-ligase
MNFRGTLEQDLPDETLPHPESASDHPVEQRGEQPAPPAPAEESGPVDVGAFKPPYATDFDDIEDFGAIWSVGPSGSVGPIRPKDGQGPGDAALMLAHAAHSEERKAARTIPPSTRAAVTYADAGVDITSGDRSKQRIKMLARKTFNKNVLSEIGGFGGLFGLDLEKFPDPVLVSSADGVGTKLKVAFELGIHHTVGQDLVNHCVNDIAVQGATPLFFLDYLATGVLEASVIETVVQGISDACRANGCALLGGETAQMPGFYAKGEYDLAGFIVGAVSRSKVVTGDTIEPGDVLIGLPSNGLHTNGYSLARKLLFEVAKYGPDQYVNELKDKTGAALMRTHRSYLGIIKKLCSGELVSGMAHITGGGITENLPRILPKGMGAAVDLASWQVPPLFEHLRELGNVDQDEMLRTFNMGIGLICVVPAEKVKKAKAVLNRANERHVIMGRITRGERKVTYNA